MNTQLRNPNLVRAACAALALSATALATAQTVPPSTTRIIAIRTQVKPEMLNEWLDLQKNEVNPALKKAGVKSRNVSSAAFGNTYEYLSTSPLENYGLLDGPGPLVRALGPEAAARLNAKLRKCIDSQRVYIINGQTDLSDAPGSPSPVRVSVRRRVAPGKGEEYRNFLKNEILPVYKKAKADGKIAGFTMSTRGLGAIPGEFTTTTHYSKFADIEGGTTLVKVLGQEGAAKLNAKGAGLSSIIETVVRRHNADLSF